MAMTIIFLILLFSSSSFCFAQNLSALCAHKPDGLYAEPRNPSYYWQCSSNGLHASLHLCPPSTRWNQTSTSCINANTTTSLHLDCSRNCSSLSNLTAAPAAEKPPAAAQEDQSSTVPNNNNVWGWNGMLHCYGAGCSARGDGGGRLPQDMGLGVPCDDGRELLALAERHAMAWIPAPPHFGEEQQQQQQYWKVKFDSIEKGRPTSLLRATLTDERAEEAAKFAIRGPLRSGGGGGGGGCYYGITLEEPAMEENAWPSFLQALLSKQKEMVWQGEDEEGEAPPTMQRCIRKLPWPRLLSTALCVAGGGNTRNNNNNNMMMMMNPLNRFAPCISFSPSDLSSLATCITAFSNLAPSISKQPQTQP